MIPSTFSGLRRYGQARDWLLFSEAMERLKGEGYLVTPWDFRREVHACGLPLVKRYGHYHYTDGHLEAVRAYARREGFLNWKGC